MTSSPHSLDTDDRAAEVQTSLLRRMTSTEKAQCIRDLTRTVYVLAAAGVRTRHPGFDDREVRYRLAEMRLGADVAARAYPSRGDHD